MPKGWSILLCITSSTLHVSVAITFTSSGTTPAGVEEMMQDLILSSVDYKLSVSRVETSYVEIPAEGFITMSVLIPGEIGEVKVVAVNGEFDTLILRISKPAVLGPIIQAKMNVVIAELLIDMMSAIAFLFLVEITVCGMKKNQGEDNSFHVREVALGMHDHPEETGFYEYAQPLNKSHGRGSMGSDMKHERCIFQGKIWQGGTGHGIAIEGHE